MNRGVARRPLFEDRDDTRFFLSRLAKEVRHGRLEVHAFCLMTNHYHILVRSPIGELAEAMCRVQYDHSRRFNRKRDRDGTLIRGRYFSKPVHSLTYRRILVSYIDGNPVKARMVKDSHRYALGSARHYVNSKGPIWLSRDWIESEAMRIADTKCFSASAYLRAFGNGSSREADELVAARIASTAVEDPLDDLIAASPKSVRSWMQSRARLADGHQIGLPVCGKAVLKRALTAQRMRPWIVKDGRHSRCGFELATSGLLRDLCGLGWKDIALAQNRTIATVRRNGDHHWRLVSRDLGYASRVATIVRFAMENFLPRGTG
ncbi:MAG: transposase [bacterium]